MAHVAALPPLPAFRGWRCHAGWKWKRAGERAEPGAAGQRCKRRGWWLVAWRAGWHRRLRQAAGQSSCGWWSALQRVRCGWAVGGACARGGGGAPRNFIVTRRLCAHAGAMWHPEDHRCAGDLMFYLVAVIARGGARRGAAGGGQRQAVAPGSTSWRASSLKLAGDFGFGPRAFLLPRLSFRDLRDWS